MTTTRGARTAAAVGLTITTAASLLPASALASNDLSPSLPASSKDMGKDAKVLTTTRHHTMRSGDSLWRVSARHLGHNASDRHVFRYLIRIWDLNAPRIYKAKPSADPNTVPRGFTLTMPRPEKA